MQLLLSKDNKSMAYLYENYAEILYGIIHEIVKNDALAEEILMDCFLQYWDRVKYYDPQKMKLFTWMNNIARVLAVESLHASQSVSHQNIEEVTDHKDVYKPEEIQNISISGIGILLEKLNPDQQHLLNLVYFKGFSQSEISEELAIPLGTVKSRIRNVLLKLRK